MSKKEDQEAFYKKLNVLGIYISKFKRMAIPKKFFSSLHIKDEFVMGDN